MERFEPAPEPAAEESGEAALNQLREQLAEQLQLGKALNIIVTNYDELAQSLMVELGSHRQEYIPTPPGYKESAESVCGLINELEALSRQKPDQQMPVGRVFVTYGYGGAEWLRLRRMVKEQWPAIEVALLARPPAFPNEDVMGMFDRCIESLEDIKLLIGESE